MGVIHSNFENTSDFNCFLNGYADLFKDALSLLTKIDCNPLVQAILNCHGNKRKIIFMGNGGSAANATHMSIGLSYITRKWDNPIKSMSLSNDSILMSSLANDFSMEDIFLKQLQVHLDLGDLVIALSVSGKSKNILKALDYTKKSGCNIFALTGSDGGSLQEYTNNIIKIGHDECLFGLTEDVHMILGHALSYYLESYFQNLDKKA